MMAFASFSMQALLSTPAMGRALVDSMRNFSQSAVQAGIDTLNRPLAEDPAIRHSVNPIMVFLVLVALLLWLFREPLRLALARYEQTRKGEGPAPMAAKELIAANRIGLGLGYESAYVLTLLREGDRLTTQRALLARLALSREQLIQWDKLNWKALARHQLALLRLLRPLVYADYRDRIWLDSPSFGKRVMNGSFRKY